MKHHAVSLLGYLVFAGVACSLSSNRRKIAWRTIAWGAALQLLIGLIIFRFPFSHRILLWLNDAVLALLSASKSASVFLFGPLAAGPGESGSIGFILIFQLVRLSFSLPRLPRCSITCECSRYLCGSSPNSSTEQ